VFDALEQAVERCDAGADHVLIGGDLALVASVHQILNACLRDRDARLGYLQYVAAGTGGVLADLDADAARGDGSLKVLCHVSIPAFFPKSPGDYRALKPLRADGALCARVLPWCILVPGKLLVRPEPIAQPLQLTLQPQHLIFERAATLALPLKLLDSLAQRVDFVRPSILVCHFACLGALDALKRLLARHFGCCPALLGLRKPGVKFTHTRRLIRPAPRATQGKHPFGFPDRAELRSQRCPQCPAAHRHSGSAERLERRHDLLVRKLAIHAGILSINFQGVHVPFGGTLAPERLNVPRFLSIYLAQPHEI
jgi:hypothetical protein